MSAMEPYFSDDTVTLYAGDCRDALAVLAPASIDAVVTDPPYELGFMGRAWDSSGIAYDVDMWRQCWDALKPGGHLLAFGGTRTYHRMVCAIEDAGFEIRDSIHWAYGSGYPKGQDIAKAIDRRREDRTEVLQVTAWLSSAMRAAGWTNPRVDAVFGFNGMSSHWTAVAGKAACVPTPEQWDRLRDEMGFDDREIRPLVAKLNGRKGALGEAWAQREVVGQAHRVRRESTVQIAGLSDGTYDLTAPGSDAARQWQGWNTSLKPAHEPIVVARKSTGFNTTVANVLECGTGAINIDACRASRGRWPTNLVLTHPDACTDECASDCPVADMDAHSGVRASEGDSGGASRFFPVFRYEAKAPASERPRGEGGTAHATVKPLALMRWLVRLATQPGGVVLDPFLGSGTTAEACVIEGFRCIGIERDETHLPLIKARLAKPIQPALGFEDAS